MQHGPPLRAGEWPQVVALVDRGSKGAGIFGSELKGVFCTGTLIRPTIILTAAHCIAAQDTEQARSDLPQQVSIYHGNGRLNYLGAVQGQSRITRAKVHPDSGKGVDLALLLLDQPLSGVVPAQLYSAAVAAHLPIISVGFGETRPAAQRQNTMGQKSAAQRRIDLQADGELCSLRAEVKLVSSAGDSGGPALTRTTDGSYQVVGALTGFRTKIKDGRSLEADCWIPVTAHAGWIQSSIAELESPPASNTH